MYKLQIFSCYFIHHILFYNQFINVFLRGGEADGRKGSEGWYQEAERVPVFYRQAGRRFQSKDGSRWDQEEEKSNQEKDSKEKDKEKENNEEEEEIILQVVLDPWRVGP